MNNKKTIKKSDCIWLFISLLINGLRIYLTVGYETRNIYIWQPFVFICLRILSLICLGILIRSAIKNTDKRKHPALYGTITAVTDIAVWTLTSGKMAVMIFRLLSEYGAQIRM